MIRVLLVEDDPVIRQIHRVCLEELGCKVQVAVNGTEALNFSHETFDLILLDIGLPEISGIEVAKKIRESEHNCRAVPLIFLTAFKDKEIYDLCLNFTNDIFIKPLSRNQLSEMIIKIKEV